MSENKLQHPLNYWEMLWKHFKFHPLGLIAYYILIAFLLIAIYAPFLASSKPLFVYYDGQPYFPLFKYLFYSGFFTKLLDLFFNLLIFTFPIALLTWKLLKQRPLLRNIALLIISTAQIGLFAHIALKEPSNPAANSSWKSSNGISTPNWPKELEHLSPYGRLNLLLRNRLRYAQHESLQKYVSNHSSLPTLWQAEIDHENREIDRQKQLEANNPPSATKAYAEAKINYLQQRRQWINQESANLHFMIMPLLRPYHWEDDAGGGQEINQQVPWWDLTRTNQKDLLAALIFGTRISLVVGLLSTLIALAIALPIGAFAGYYGGRFDIIVSRLLEIWESMPTFFMLLMVVAITGSKSVFLVIAIIGLFGWTGFSRYIRGEFFKQRHLPYVEACKALGYSDSYIMFRHLLPNGIPPLLTLLPFAIMGAITSEAGLSFLGLGEEGSCSWGVLMDEGRNAFPAESYLLWPPAFFLTLLLVAIALAGDALRDALDPRQQIQ